MSIRDQVTDLRGSSVFESRYDLLLAILPLPLLLGAASGVLTSIPASLGVGVGSIPSALLLAYGLFVDAPRATNDPKRRNRAV